ncbi:MAG: hypothetical protein NTY68_03115 [Candidatus Micrarchaeota archaeon]|nr:hypothetical protein [Candidatus Micrarchaeota archaeon]
MNQKTAEAPGEQKKENVSKFKGALKGIRTKIRNRMMPIILGSAILLSPSFRNNETYSQESNVPIIVQIENEYPSIKNFEMLKHMIYLTRSDEINKLSDMTKKVIENVSKQIVKNQGNMIYGRVLDAVLEEVLQNKPDDKDYYISADEEQIIVKDDAKDPTKMMLMMPEGKDGISISFYSSSEWERRMVLNPRSTGKDVDGLRLRSAKFFDTLLPTLIMINMELDENRRNN